MYEYLGLMSCNLSGFVRVLCRIKGELMIWQLPKEELEPFWSAIDYMRRRHQ